MKGSITCGMGVDILAARCLSQHVSSPWNPTLSLGKHTTKLAKSHIKAFVESSKPRHATGNSVTHVIFLKGALWCLQSVSFVDFKRSAHNIGKNKCSCAFEIFFFFFNLHFTGSLCYLLNLFFDWRLSPAYNWADECVGGRTVTLPALQRNISEAIQKCLTLG